MPAAVADVDHAFCAVRELASGRAILIRRAIIYAADELGLVSRTTARESSSDNP